VAPARPRSGAAPGRDGELPKAREALARYQASRRAARAAMEQAAAEGPRQNGGAAW
jgi:hypothetical protein